MRELQPGTTYQYALRAVNDADMHGPISNLVNATTLGEAPAINNADSRVCSALTDPNDEFIRYPAGYSLVGLPEGSVVNAGSPLYGWFDQGAGADYLVRDSEEVTQGGHGYWAWFPCPSLVTPSDSPASKMVLPLGEYHASMIGNPSRVDADVYGHDFTARWDAAANGGSGGYEISEYRDGQGPGRRRGDLGLFLRLHPNSHRGPRLSPPFRLSRSSTLLLISSVTICQLPRIRV